MAAAAGLSTALAEPVLTPNRSLLARTIPALVVVAILGYLAGGGLSGPKPARAGPPAPEGIPASPNPVVLNYPSAYGWTPSTGAPRFAGLPVSEALVLAPHGLVARAGLIAGEMPAAAAGPLPQQFLQHEAGAIKGEVVSLLDTQAYRYSRVSLTATNRRLTLYAIPNAIGTTTTILCYAPQSKVSTSYLWLCEQIAAQLTLQVQAQSTVLLTPEAGYAHQIASIVGQLDQLRVEMRAAMRSPRVSPATLSAQAIKLARAINAAGGALAALQPPPAAASAHAALSAALVQARDSYQTLGAAAGGAGASAYRTARTRVYKAESEINIALQDFAQLGYG